MSAGLDRLIDQLHELADWRVRTLYDRLDERGITSPIEKYFVVALQEVLQAFGGGTSPIKTLALAKSAVAEQDLEFGRIHVWAQIRALDWPADFVLGTLSHDKKRHFALVECDGHDFHERTKEQAERDRSRDRRVQEMGWRMFRFTGSELYRDSVNLVLNDILHGWAINLWADKS
jgi:very-short-patch-repair endonuclease